MTSSIRPHDVTRIVCLVIEDHAESASLFEVILRDWRIETRTAATARAARWLLEEELPDVIICDLKLSDESGFSFIRWLRSHPRRYVSRIPAIAVTVHPEEFTARQAREAGFDLYLTKPLDLDDLPHQVVMLVARRSQAD